MRIQYSEQYISNISSQDSVPPQERITPPQERINHLQEMINDPLVEASINGCQKSIEKLYIKNKPLISYAINNYKQYIPEDEIYGCYDMAFYKAITNYDSSKSAQFKTYLFFLLGKEVLTEISKYTDIYIPEKIRSMAFKVSMCLYYSGVSNHSEAEIRYAMSQFNYDNKYYSRIKKALPIVIYESCFRATHTSSDDLVIMQMKSEVTNSPEDMDSIYLKENLHYLINDAINMYCQPAEREQIKTLITTYLQSEGARESYTKTASYLLGCSEVNVTNKFYKTIGLLRDYFECKGITLQDLIQ